MGIILKKRIGSRLFFLGIFLAVSACVSGQKPPENKEEYDKAYEWRIRQEYLYDVYIPADLTDAFIQLNRLIDEPSKQKFKGMDEEEAAHQLFFSLGRWIIYNWGFYGGSRLSHFLRGLGITHPEDMGMFVMITYHRNLNRSPLEVKSLVERFQEERKKEVEEKHKEGTILYEETRKVGKNGG
ncbi:MAG: hypothetical protein H6563_09195 [Lewinellaceae bacterium]|nr:hypothetical protein [Lewinellaceae bacterium]